MRSVGNSEPWTDFSIGCTESEYDHLISTINKEIHYNGWFTPENVRMSIGALGEWLTEDKLTEWANDRHREEGKNILIIMAGNIPLVGFHDLLTVLISGNKAMCKMSSDDRRLLPAFATILLNFNPDWKERMQFVHGSAKGFDAVIATGSDNSAKYFEQYFGQYPHIFRKNRTSIAVLNGNESEDELKELGNDIFQYFGLGCRNVNHLMFPEGYKLDTFFEGIFPHGEVINNNKYGNNYDYNKAIYLMNKIPLLDNNFVLLRESQDLFSPISVLHYQFYRTEQDVEQFLGNHTSDIQVVVGSKYEAFGKAQCPSLFDYADGIDSYDWLMNLD